MGSVLPDIELIKQSIACKCPRCHKGNLFEKTLSFEIIDQCKECDLNLSEHDVGDGPAVFLIFILGFLLVPLAILIEQSFTPPLWVHAITSTLLALLLTLLFLKPLKSYIIALQFKHRPGEWKE